MELRSRERKPAGELVAMSFGLIMVVLYIVLGTTIIFKASEIPNIPTVYARIFGIMLILYGAFRGYKIYNRYFKKSES